jgi:hypothetical protein
MIGIPLAIILGCCIIAGVLQHVGDGIIRCLARHNHHMDDTKEGINTLNSEFRGLSNYHKRTKDDENIKDRM